MKSIFAPIHRFCAAGMVSHQDKTPNHEKSLAATPLLGLAIGTIGLVMAVAGMIISALAILILALPGLCGWRESEKYLKIAVSEFLYGLLYTGLYLAMMIYGQTIGWITHNPHTFNKRSFEKIA